MTIVIIVLIISIIIIVVIIVGSTPDLPTKSIPARIRRLKTSGKSPCRHENPTP